jgi:hypothetical protein
MGKKALSAREAWQPYGGEKAGKAERNFHEVFTEHFKGTDFEVKPHPREFKNIYSAISLPKNVIDRIYNPNETWSHGVIPDFSIHNRKSGKTIYVEVKRQDGWVEGKERKAGRGNAHERSCKLFTPGLYFRVILHATPREFERFIVGTRELRGISSFGVTPQMVLAWSVTLRKTSNTY